MDGMDMIFKFSCFDAITFFKKFQILRKIKDPSNRSRLDRHDLQTGNFR